MTEKTPIVVAKGDGIGPEIMDATLRIMDAAGAQIEPHYVEIGEKAYKAGIMNGISDEAWEAIRKHKVILKAPLTTPQGGGYKSVNVTMRKALGLFANVRPTKTYNPHVKSRHENIDMVIVRENEEDLYAGIEYRQTRDTCHSVKLITRTGSEMIIRYAFEYARAHGRKKVTCLIKDNIMKISDGLFHKAFKLIAKEYPEIEADALIVDIGMARVADSPENFDVVVTLNLYGDIVSDIASQIAGSVGLAGSSNIGCEYAMFEAVHGSAPDITGQGIANPSGLLNGAVLMLKHIGQSDVADKIENAWLKTLEDGTHTADIAGKDSKKVNTKEFADAVIANLGEKPQKLPMSKPSDKKMVMPSHDDTTQSIREKKLVGVDVFIDSREKDIATFCAKAQAVSQEELQLVNVTSRGVQVYPQADMKKVVTDQWRCRFEGAPGIVTNAAIRHILERLEGQGLDWIKIENLYMFDDERCFSV